MRAERERIPQAGALPDPVLSLGIENEGFDGITVGEMEACAMSSARTGSLGSRGGEAEGPSARAGEASATAAAIAAPRRDRGTVLSREGGRMVARAE